jgi:hypothetical protein
LVFSETQHSPGLIGISDRAEGRVKRGNPAGERARITYWRGYDHNKNNKYEEDCT